MSERVKPSRPGFMLPGARNPVSFPLRLPRTSRKQAGDMARREGVSLNQFIAQAIAEKITRMEGDVAK